LIIAIITVTSPPEYGKTTVDSIPGPGQPIALLYGAASNNSQGPLNFRRVIVCHSLKSSQTVSVQSVSVQGINHITYIYYTQITAN